MSTTGAIELVRGRGMWIGVVLTEPRAAEVLATCRDEGLLVGAVGDRILRLAPALTIGDAEIDKALELLKKALTKP